MERFYICIHGHSFRVTDNTDRPPSKSENEVYFGVSCPVCSSVYEIHWPSGRPFKVERLSTQS
jgi:hypothetical protein